MNRDEVLGDIINKIINIIIIATGNMFITIGEGLVLCGQKNIDDLLIQDKYNKNKTELF